MRIKHTFRLPVDLSDQLGEIAVRKRVSQTRIAEAAIRSYLSPDAADRMEAAMVRRLDRLSRQMDRLERHIQISNETLALFVRSWLVSTPPLPDTALAAAQASGRERYQGFIEALARRLETGMSLATELSQDIIPRDVTDA
ncbi:CopG family transcriptional regulator [Sphingopyxis indica]|uniref:Ribbon-helix-helix protein, copG family n=1 Tax=Sphingopyxis indica TaxID=436663 RepID=A0A239L2W0_9SPHN|nr:CopG family transcriptional regulator [Sphingopyxis indica]SNT24248.1 hypothetical protein SAMN06295955_11851 [Sphingopyxis indica]